MIRATILAAALVALGAGSAPAVSLMDVIGKCGDDAKAYCQGVGYGDPMTACLAKNKAKLKPECKVIVARIEGGDKVSLF